MDNEKVRPLNGMVLLRVNDDVPERPSAGGLFLPDNAKGRPKLARVIAVSRGYFQGGRLIEPLVRKGEEVLFDPYKITMVLSHGQLATAQGSPVAKAGEHLLIHENRILAVTKELDTDA